MKKIQLQIDLWHTTIKLHRYISKSFHRYNCHIFFVCPNWHAKLPVVAPSSIFCWEKPARAAAKRASLWRSFYSLIQIYININWYSFFIWAQKQLIVSCVTCPWIHGCVGVYVGTGGGGVVPYVGISPYVGIFSSAANNPRFIFLPAAPAHAHEYKVILMASVYIGTW